MGRRSAYCSRVGLTLSLILAVVFLLPLTSLGQLNQAPDSQKKGDLSEVEKDNPFERLKAQERENGKITPAYRDKVLREAEKHNQRLGRSSRGVVEGTPGQPTSGATWINIGPTGQQFAQNGSFTGEIVDSGRLRTILTHPTDANIVYVLSSAGGLWKTTNFESAIPNWTPLTDFLPTTAGGAAAFGRTPSVIYLGLGDPYDQITVGGSIVKSDDGGASWSPLVTLGNTISVRDVKVDTSGTSDVVLVATDGGLWRSVDAGASYNQVTNHAFQNQYIWSLAKSSAGWVMATQETQAILNGNCIPATRWCTGAGHIYLSTDKGANWLEQFNGITNTFGRTTLGIGAEGDAVVYAFSALPTSGTLAAPGTSAATNQRDLYRSADGGKTWVALGVNSTKVPTNPLPYQLDMNIMVNQAWYNQTIGVDPTDPTRNTVYIGGTYSAAKSSDGGVSWKILSQWLYDFTPGVPYIHADMHAMAFKTAGTKAVLLGSDGGIFASTDAGNTWDSNKNNNLVTHMFYTIIGNPLFPNFAMGGLQDNGTRVRLDNTGIFNQSNGGDGFGVGFSQANAKTALQSVYNLSMRRSRTELPPKNYTEMQRSLGALAEGGFYTPIYSPAAAADPSGLYFYSYGAASTTGHILFTNDGGIKWFYLVQIGAVGSGLPAGMAFRDNPFGFGMSPIDMKHMAIGANGGRCFVSVDGGLTWASNLTTNSVVGWPGFVGNVTWGDDNTIWVTSTSQSEGLYTGVTTVRVVKSSDRGATWTAAGKGLPDVPVTKVQVDPRDSNTAYAATHLGVYRTTDGGANWSPYGAGLPNVRVNDIYMPSDGGYLRVATYGRGIWQLSSLDYVGATLSDDGDSCNLDGNIGNEENGHLTLTFTNPTGAAVAGGTATVVSDNAHLTIVGGNVITLGTVAANGTASGSLAVKVTGAIGIETANLRITYGDSALVTITRPIAFNYDDDANASGSVVNFESVHSGWTFSSVSSPKLGDNFLWERREITPVLHTMAVTDANGIQDTSLVSPALKIGAGPASFSFTHRWNFEADVNGNYDGGIIEISQDAGASWSQLIIPDYNGAILGGPSGFINTNVGWPAPVTSSVIDLSAYANKTVALRFRATADDNTGRQGWEIYGMTFAGLTNTPFGSFAAHNEVCKSAISIASAPNPSNFPDLVTFTSTVTGGVTPVTGTVTFTEGAITLGTATLASGTGIITISTLQVGTHQVAATYNGDAGHAAVTSSPQYKHTVLAVPRTTLTPKILDFGEVHNGKTSPVLTSILLNTGKAPLNISGIVASGDFQQTNNCPTFLAATYSCTISVTFKPVGVLGIHTGVVTLTSDSFAGDTSIALTGKGVSSKAKFNRTSIPYANTLVGFSPAQQVITVTNSGNLPLTIATVVATGDYTQTNDCATPEMPVDSFCTVNVTFAPTANGDRTGALTLTTDTDDTPETVSLSGKGELLQISGTTSQTVSKQTKATYPLILKSSTGFAGVVSLSCSGAPALTTCTFDTASPAMLVSDTKTVTVSITPAPTTTTASAAHTGEIFFAAFGLLGLLLLPLARKASGLKVLSTILLALVITISVGGMIACGGGSNPAPVKPPTTTTTFATPGTYPVTVTAKDAAGSTLQTQTLTLTLQ